MVLTGCVFIWRIVDREIAVNFKTPISIVSVFSVPNAQPTIIQQKGATAWVDGQNGLGAVVGDFCTQLAIKLAKEHGVGWVVCKGSNHFGIAGYWPLLMKEHGFLVNF